MCLSDKNVEKRLTLTMRIETTKKGGYVRVNP